MQEHDLQRYINELTRRLDAIVNAWNTEHPDQLIAIEHNIGASGGPVRMYRYVDRILSLRLFPLTTQYPKLQRGEVLVGGTLGFPLANWGLNLLLLRPSGAQPQWQVLEASEGLRGPRTHLLARTVDEFQDYTRRVSAGLTTVQVVMRALTDEELRSLLQPLTADVVALV